MAITRNTEPVPAWATGIARAEASNQGGEYFEDGKYLVQIDEIEKVETRERGAAIVVHFTVLDSDNGVMPGSQRDWFRYVAQDAAKADLKRFFQTIIALKQGDDFEPAVHHADAYVAQKAVEAVAPDQPFAGLKMSVRVHTKPQKNNPSKSFSVHKFGPPEDA